MTDIAEHTLAGIHGMYRPIINKLQSYTLQNTSLAFLGMEPTALSSTVLRTSSIFTLRQISQIVQISKFDQKIRSRRPFEPKET